MPLELLELVKFTGTVYDSENFAIPGRLIDIGVDNTLVSEIFVTMKLQTICLISNECWGKESRIHDQRQLNASKINSIFSSFPIHLKSTAFCLFGTILFCFSLIKEVEGKPICKCTIQ